ncbi:hypothetical protein GCK72_004194 [Caenorhabditis remanei]|uniref:F-box domain-containing protein n=1 Tax=Caenorhabditis remanei TaxID=31234 RepID=A0A6A5HAT0_CAERE|nr:hypothetical protein GCK72_004194 [Caenorhabditis remanei]KAF1764247.1 hypothetical protein GCK72_004194 [Caenorhabditis remanei]
MRFSFQLLPLLVQLEVLKQLELQEVFLLSLCSEKMKTVVQCLNMRPTKLKYLFLKNGVQVSAGYGNNQIYYGVANVQFVSTIPSGKMKPMKLGGNKINCRCFKKSSKAKLSHGFRYLAQEQITVLESLQCHMKGLFRFKPRVQLEFTSLHYINISRIINDVTDSRFEVEELETEQLENYLTIHPGQDSLLLETKLTGLRLKSDSKLYSIKGLVVYGKRIDPFIFVETRQNPRLHFSEVINNFGGEYLFFLDVVYNINDWAQLIQSWKSKEAYQKLKFVLIRAPRGASITFEHAMRQFDFKAWDGQRRPRTVKLEPKIVNLKLNSYKNLDCSKWMDIQQDGGGKWASIMLSQTFIQFIVWH